MADFNPIFEVDAAAILTKLHLAGQDQANNSIVINTAIKNPDKGAKPDSPGKVEFDLENKSGEYQLAVIRPLEYLVPIDPSKNKEYVEAKDALDKFMKDHEKELPKQDEKSEDKDNQNNKKEETDKKTSLTDPKAKDKAEIKKESIQVKSFLQYITEDSDKEDNKLKEELKKLQEPLLEIYNEYKKNGLKGYEDVNSKETDSIDYNASAKKFEEALTEVNKQRLEDKEKLTNECKKAALGDLKTYFINFAGKDNQAKIKDADIVVKNATAEGHLKDPNEFQENIKDYKIEVDSVDEEIKKKQDELQNDIPTVTGKLYAHDVALIVGYKVDID